ncbi:mitochondrial carrier, partial [Mycena vulgaris]
MGSLATVNELLEGSVGGAAQVLVGQPLDTVKHAHKSQQVQFCNLCSIERLAELGWLQRECQKANGHHHADQGFFVLYKATTTVSPGQHTPLLFAFGSWLDGGIERSVRVGKGGGAYGVSQRIISPFPRLSLAGPLACSMVGAANAILASLGTPFHLLRQGCSDWSGNADVQGPHAGAVRRRDRQMPGNRPGDVDVVGLPQGSHARVTVAREIPADAGFYTVSWILDAAYEFSKRQFGAKYGDQLPIWALLASGSTGDVIKSHIRPRKTPPTGTPVQYIGHEFKLIVAESGFVGLCRHSYSE